MYASPFDEAASKPLDTSSQKKKFSWTSTVATVFTIDELDDSSYVESYVAPSTTEASSDYQLEGMEELSDNPRAPLVTIDLEQAVLQERHSGIQEITSSLQQVKDIQQDLAQVVDSQGTSLQQMSWLAIEAFDETSSGLQDIQRSSYSTMEAWIKTRQRNAHQRKSFIGVLVSFLLLAAYAIHKLTEDPQDYNGDPQKFP